MKTETIENLRDRQRLWRRRLDDLKTRESELWAEMSKNLVDQKEARERLLSVNDEIERSVK